MVRLRGEKIMRAYEFTSKSEITPLELKTMADFSKCQNRMFSGEGIVLKDRIVLALSFYKSLSNTKVLGKIATTLRYIPGADSFLDNFVTHYTSNIEFRDSLVVHLIKGYVSKVEASDNPLWYLIVLTYHYVP